MRLLLVCLGLAALLGASQFALRAFGPPEGGRLAERVRAVTREFPAPPAPLADLRGGALSLAGREGVTLATLWATWCGPCRRELPELARLAAAWEGRGVSVLAVSVDGPETMAGVPAHLAALGVPFAPLHDSGGALAASVGLVGTPTTLVIDRFGRIVAFVVGPGPWADPKTADWLAALVAAETPDASRALLSSPPFARS